MDEEKGIVQLIEQVKNGDERAFAEFYSQTYKYVYSRAKCMFSDEQEVQDLVQEVYLALYRNAANIQSGESIFGWLKTTTFYQGTKMLKKKRKEVLLSEEGEGMFESIPDDEPEIEEGYMNQEDVQVIRECINRLSDEQKTVLLAYYYDNLKVNEIAEILSLSAGTVKSRLYLARKNLQVHIEEEEKKRGYKLHSFGAVTLALALRMFLQGNMEVVGSVEETIFAKVCQGLNFEVSKTVAAQSGIAEQVAQEGTKQAGKGILGKLGALGAKKIAISAVGIIAAATIGGLHIEDMTSLKVVDNFTIEYGNKISNQVADYVPENTDEKIVNNATVEIVGNDENSKYPTLGDYVVKVKYKNQVKEVIVTVADTTKPVFVEFNKNINIYTGEQVDWNTLFVADDLSEITISVDDSAVNYSAEGIYQITVTATDALNNSVSETANLNITQTSLLLNTTSISMEKGNTYQLQSTVVGRDQNVKYKSSNTSVVTVDADGQIVGVGQGVSTVTVEANGLSVDCKVTVTVVSTEVPVDDGLDYVREDAAGWNNWIP